MDCEIPPRLERGTSANKDAGPRRRVDCEILHRLERGTNILYKGVKISPSRHVLKTLKGSPKRTTSASSGFGQLHVNSHVTKVLNITRKK